MRTFLLICITTLLLSPAKKPGFNQFCDEFVQKYQSLNLPQRDLAYIDMLRHIKSPDSVRQQQNFFKGMQAGLADFHRATLDKNQRLDYDLIQYETTLNLQRLDLESRWTPTDKITAGGIISIPNGKEWYAYLLKRWVDADVTPDQIYQFGLSEIDRVEGHIKNIQQQTGLTEDEFYRHLNDSSFFIKDPAEVQKAFERARAIVQSNLYKLFSDTVVPPLNIARGEEKALAQTPGYYNPPTFYYNLFDKPYNKRQVDWLYIHEGIPGHHYQISIANKLKVSPVQALFTYFGYIEGWGAYAEELGKDLGLYQTPYDELGKWEWDIVRSVRVPLDVGLNYYGWTDEQALAFWKKNIRGQDDIAQREINRMRRWPAQVVTYKYGALQFLHWRQQLKIDIRRFHDKVLNRGALPFSILLSTFTTDESP